MVEIEGSSHRKVPLDLFLFSNDKSEHLRVIENDILHTSDVMLKVITITYLFSKIMTTHDV